MDYSNHNIFQVFCALTFGEVAERLKAAVLKTVKGFTPFQGSNPCLSANELSCPLEYNLEPFDGKKYYGNVS
jgi:hypothetical protein